MPAIKRRVGRLDLFRIACSCSCSIDFKLGVHGRIEPQVSAHEDRGRCQNSKGADPAQNVSMSLWIRNPLRHDDRNEKWGKDPLQKIGHLKAGTGDQASDNSRSGGLIDQVIFGNHWFKFWNGLEGQDCRESSSHDD